MHDLESKSALDHLWAA